MKRILRLWSLAFVAPTVAAAACNTSSNGSDPTPSVNACMKGADIDPLRWKRGGVVLRDLASALSLEAATACTELGTNTCEKLYRVTLGGNDAFDSAVYSAPDEPLATTPIVIDRIALKSCVQRATADAASSHPVVFTRYPLAGPPPDPNAPAVAEQIGDLYRRLLARDATAEEVQEVASLARDSASAQEFSVLACFAVASTLELFLI